MVANMPQLKCCLQLQYKMGHLLKHVTLIIHMHFHFIFLSMKRKAKLNYLLIKILQANDNLSLNATLINYIIFMKGKSSVAFSLFAKANFKILVVGDKDVGKTSLIIREIKHTFTNKKNVSLGIEFYSKTIQIDKDEIALQIWDTAAGNVSTLAKSFYQQASCIIIAYCDPNKVQETIDRYILEANEYANAAVMIAIVRTKADQSPLNSEEKSILDSYIQTKDSVHCWMQTSAKTGEGVGEFFRNISTSLYVRYNEDQNFKEMVDPKKDSFMLKGTIVEEEENTRKKRCCS